MLFPVLIKELYIVGKNLPEYTISTNKLSQYNSLRETLKISKNLKTDVIHNLINIEEILQKAEETCEIKKESNEKGNRLSW